MLLNNLNEEPEYGVRYGIIFYFYESPNKCRQQLHELFSDFCELVNMNFTYGTSTGNSHSKFENQKGAIDYFSSFLYDSDFSTTKHLMLTNATKKSLQTIKFECMFSTIEDNFKVKLPNWIYIEVDRNIYFNDIYHFIKNAFYSMTYHYCLCNFVLVKNALNSNKTNPHNIKKLRDTIILNDVDSVLINSDFTKNLIEGIDGPNCIQVLSKSLYEKVGWENIINSSSDETYLHEFGEDYVILKIPFEPLSDNEKDYLFSYKSLYDLLKPIIVPIKKPLMYWKQHEWDKWINRFND